jgi:hypothetical protein
VQHDSSNSHILSLQKKIKKNDEKQLSVTISISGMQNNKIFSTGDLL